MRKHKIVKGLIQRANGWHQTYTLMIKVMKEGKWTGRWAVKRDEIGRAILDVVV